MLLLLAVSSSSRRACTLFGGIGIILNTYKDIREASRSTVTRPDATSHTEYVQNQQPVDIWQAAFLARRV